ncbi:MAG: hypothetical protein WBF03_06445 [Xanthobacteraceae bacterium]
MEKKPKTKTPPAEVLTFADAARLTAPNDTPAWLPAQLEWWAQGIRHDRLADKYRPMKAETRQRLKAVGEASLLLQRELDAPAIRNLLMAAKSTKKISISKFHLQDLSERADIACSSPALTALNGKAKRGRGKPKVPDLFDARTLCAARVVELWLHFHGIEPGLGNVKAAAAAQAYWRASGGKSEGYGNPLNGWYDYFRIVRGNKETAGLIRLRLIWRRDLEQARTRGRPPWYLGTYFPLPNAEFKSPVEG